MSYGTQDAMDIASSNLIGIKSTSRRAVVDAPLKSTPKVKKTKSKKATKKSKKSK